MSNGFLSRWARRKQAVRVTERSDRPVADAAATEATLDPAQPPGEAPRLSSPVAPAERPAEGPADPVTDDLLAKLPSLDALTPDTDLSAFLQAGVPTALRNAALRRMWSLDPAIRDFVSEAREYAYDWNTPGGVPGMGPLLPTDDVKAMLRRIIDGVPAKTDGGVDAESPNVSDPPPTPSALSSDTTIVAASPELEAAPVAEDSLSAVEAHASVAEPAHNPPEVAPSPLLRPRLRRHGGAMPS